MDLKTIKDAYSALGYPKVIAIIGSDIFHRYNAIIDYEKLKISLPTNDESQ